MSDHFGRIWETVLQFNFSPTVQGYLRRFTHLKFFYTWVVPKGLNSKILCSMFVYVLFYVGLCTEPILWVLNNLWFDDLRAEKIGDRLSIVFSRDVILYG